MCLNERLLTKKHSILIFKIREKLVALKKYKKDVKFVWIPAYAGILLNEIADATVKEGIRKGEDAQYLIPGRDLTSHWKTKLRVATEECYRESGKQKGRKDFKYYHQNNDKP
jgi:ribonuclease HI